MEQLDFFLSHKVWDLIELHLTDEQQAYYEKKFEKKNPTQLENVDSALSKVRSEIFTNIYKTNLSYKPDQVTRNNIRRIHEFYDNQNDTFNKYKYFDLAKSDYKF